MLRFGSIHVEIGLLHGKGKVYGKSKCYAFFLARDKLCSAGGGKGTISDVCWIEEASFEMYAIGNAMKSHFLLVGNFCDGTLISHIRGSLHPC